MTSLRDLAQKWDALSNEERARAWFMVAPDVWDALKDHVTPMSLDESGVPFLHLHSGVVHGIRICKEVFLPNGGVALFVQPKEASIYPWTSP